MRAAIADLRATDIVAGLSVLRILKLSLRILADAFRHFIADDGWAIASHIALSTLMALFPFLIVVTALAGFFFGSKELADEAARILLEAWPKEVAGPIALDVAGVLTDTRGDVLTFGLLFALYFASTAWKACASGSTALMTPSKSGRGGCCGWN